VAKVSGMKDETYPGLFPSMYGAPDDIVAQIGRLAELGVAGSTLVFLNYLDELPYFVTEVCRAWSALACAAPKGLRPKESPSRAYEESTALSILMTPAFTSGSSEDEDKPTSAKIAGTASA
jgi:hypothetical protein